MDLSGLRPTYAEIDLDAIAQNVRALMGVSKGAAMMAVVKADGYGHGALPVARAALSAGATWLGVATVEEGVALRQAGFTVPVLILGYAPPSRAACIVEHGLRTALFDNELAVALQAAARQLGQPAVVHLKVDTGMGRVGYQLEELTELAAWLRTLTSITVEGVFTHLATADEPHHDFADQQLDRFEQAVRALEAGGIRAAIRHACNSAGIMLHPAGHYDLVRAGIALYGLPPDPTVSWPVALKPAMTWRTQVAMLKELGPGKPVSYGRTYFTTGTERIASLPVGYADGYFRGLSNRGSVLISGHRCPVIGRVCMDQIMVRLPEGCEARTGDPVVLMGEQGGERITAGEIGGLLGTINYEVVCAVSRRVPRIYRNSGRWQDSTSK